MSWQRAIWMVLAGWAIGSSGCAALVAGGAAGAATYAYVTGEQQRTYAQPVAVTAAAAQRAVEGLGMPTLVHRVDHLGAVLKTETATGKKVHITVEPEGTWSVAKIRVGTFGNEAITDQIYQQMDLNLSQPHILTDDQVAPASAIVPQPAAEPSPPGAPPTQPQ